MKDDFRLFTEETSMIMTMDAPETIDEADKNLRGSSSSLDGIKKVISDFFFGSTIDLKDKGDGKEFEVHNKKGLVKGFVVKKKGNRFRFEKLEEEIQVDEASISSDPTKDQASMSLHAEKEDELDEAESEMGAGCQNYDDSSDQCLDEANEGDFYKEKVKDDKVAKAWIKFAKDEITHKLNDEIEWSKVKGLDWNRFGWEMSQVMKRFRKGDMMPDGTEDRMWYRTFLATQGIKEYRNILKSPDANAYKDKIRKIEKATLDALSESKEFAEVFTLPLVEAREVCGHCVTKFGMANNKKFTDIKIVKDMSDRNKLVPDNFLKKVIREMDSMIGDKSVKQIGRTMYFEVPDHEKAEPRAVAKEMFSFLQGEGYVMESVVKRPRTRNKFLTEEAKPNKFLVKGSIFLKEENDTEYENWKKDYEEVSRKVDEAGAKLKEISGDNKGGLTPDHIKSSAEFKKAKADFVKADKMAKDFVKKSPKEYLKRRTQERRAKWRK